MKTRDRGLASRVAANHRVRGVTTKTSTKVQSSKVQKYKSTKQVKAIKNGAAES